MIPALLATSWADTQVGVTDSDELSVVERFRPHGVSIRARCGAFVLHLTEAKAAELHRLLGERLALLGTGQVEPNRTSREAA